MRRGQLSAWAAQLRPRWTTLAYGTLLIAVEALLLAIYWVTVPNVTVLGPAYLRYWLYPFVWINVGLWAVIRTTPAPADGRKRQLAAVIAVGYFALLAAVGGLVGLTADAAHTSFRVSALSIPPGWGPALLYDGSLFTVSLLPFKLVGYLALAYLVYATVIDATSSAVTGVLGLLSCVSCTWPVLASIVTGVAGSGTAIAGAVYSQSYGLSTIVFVVTVGLLYWRPFGQ